MVPYTVALLSDLGAGDFLTVKCAACEHEGVLAGIDALRRRAGNIRVADLAPLLRCRECDQKGKVIINIKWAAT